MKVLLTCPPMLGLRDEFIPRFSERGIELHCPDVVQILSEEELIELVPNFDGWIIGDDPATGRVFEAGRKGALRAAVKWGVGIDNVDFEGARKAKIVVDNTPFMFGAEVADVAMGYVIGLARETFFIDREVRKGQWPKPRGVSLAGKTVALVGYGDIGRNTAKRLLAAGMELQVYDPAIGTEEPPPGVTFASWPDGIEACDFMVLTCALNESTHHMVDSKLLGRCKEGLRLVNVARGPLVDETALEKALQSGRVYSAALDVMEVEPLPADSSLRGFERCIFGSHNGSNTVDAVRRASDVAMEKLFGFLGV